MWNLIPGEGSAELVKALVKEKIQASVTPVDPAHARVVWWRDPGSDAPPSPPPAPLLFIRLTRLVGTPM